MLKVDTTLNHIPAGREHVISLLESINQPLVNIPNHGTAPTGAFVLGTRNEHGYYTVFVYLHQPETKGVVVYVSEPRNLSSDQFRAEEAEAVRFVESMGFMVDNIHFSQLPVPEQEAVIARVPLFRPPAATLDLYDVADDRVPAPEAPPPAQPYPGQTGVNPMFGGLDPINGNLFQQPAYQGSGPGMAPGYPSQSPMGGQAHQPGRDQAQVGTAIVPRPFGPESAGPGPAPEVTPEVLERLGRFLAMFALAVALTLPGLVGCRTLGGPEPSQEVSSHLDLGNQQLAEGRWPEAIKSFGRVLEEDEDNKDARRGIGLALMNLGRLSQAEPHYRRAVAADPKFSIAKNELGVVLIELKRCPEAEALFRDVLEDIFYPTPEFADHNLARALACQGRMEEAIAHLEKLLLRRPLFCLGYLSLAQMGTTGKKPEVTIRACDDFVSNCEQNEKVRAHVLPSHSAMCYLHKGLAYAQIGDVESARASFLKCQSTDAIGKECRQSLEMLPR